MRQSKFNVGRDKDKRTYNGIVFDSAVEMKYYRDVVVPLMVSGEIEECVRQKKYILQPAYTHNGKWVLPIEYKADFYIRYADGREMVVDIKGCPDAIALLKRKMFHYVYPYIDYEWITWVKKFGGWINYDECKQLRKQEKLEHKQK